MGPWCLVLLVRYWAITTITDNRNHSVTGSSLYRDDWRAHTIPRRWWRCHVIHHMMTMLAWKGRLMNSVLFILPIFPVQDRGVYTPDIPSMLPWSLYSRYSLYGVVQFIPDIPCIGLWSLYSPYSLYALSVTTIDFSEIWTHDSTAHNSVYSNQPLSHCHSLAQWIVYKSLVRSILPAIFVRFRSWH